MRYCAFLRGVNVRGTTIKMADVCAVFTKAGMKDVDSVLATGNIIFSSDKASLSLKDLLENALCKRFDYEAFIFIYDQKTVLQLFDANPYEADPDWHVYAFIGYKGIEQTLMNRFKAAKKIENEDAKISKGFFFWRVPKGATLDSDFGKVLGNKVLKEHFTSRNINTIEKVLKKMGD